MFYLVRRSSKPASWVVGMAMFTMLAVKFSGIYSVDDLLAKTDSIRSTDSLIAEQKQMLREDATEVNVLQGKELRLNRQVEGWKNRKQMLESRIQSEMTNMSTMRRALKKACGECTTVIEGIKVTTCDVEADLANSICSVKGWQQQCQELDQCIADAGGHLASMAKVKSEKRGEINRRNSEIRQSEMDSMMSSMQTSGDCMDIEDSVLANRRWADIAGELQTRSLPSRSKSSSRDWSKWSAGFATEREAMLAEADSILGPDEGCPQDGFFSANQAGR